jgi:hypothetical protein
VRDVHARLKCVAGGTGIDTIARARKHRFAALLHDNPDGRDANPNAAAVARACFGNWQQVQAGVPADLNSRCGTAVLSSMPK